MPVRDIGVSLLIDITRIMWVNSEDHMRQTWKMSKPTPSKDGRQSMEGN